MKTLLTCLAIGLLAGCTTGPAITMDDVPTRPADGPPLVDAGPVPMGLAPQAVAYVNLDGSLFQSVEAWNPGGTSALQLQIVKQDPGIYDVVAPSGVFLFGGHVTAQYTPAVTGVVEGITDDTTARVHLTDSAGDGADIDCAFLVSLW